MTNKQRGMLESYEYAMRNGQKTELYQVYENYSQAKQNALEYCKELKIRLGGYNDTIVSHSAYFFTYAFKYMDYDLNKECLCYCTHANDYKFPIE